MSAKKRKKEHKHRPANQAKKIPMQVAHWDLSLWDEIFLSLLTKDMPRTLRFPFFLWI